MNQQKFSKIQYYFTGAVTLIIISLLTWQHLTDGVPSHHLFQSAEMPAMSNWWGALLLPVISWLSLGRIHKRTLTQQDDDTAKYPRNIMVGFIVSLSYGIVLSASFAFGYNDITGLMFFGLLVFAPFFKIYREQYLLGFILSMSIVFGAIIPTIFGLIIAAVSALIYYFSRVIASKFQLWFMAEKATK